MEHTTDSLPKSSLTQSLSELKAYGQLRTEAFRLGLIDNLATLFNTLFSVLLIVVLLGIATLFFAVALTWILGMIIGSLLVAILLIGSLFVVLAILVYLFRQRLITNPSVRLLCRMADNFTSKNDLP